MRDFYERSHFYIEQLKGEYFEREDEQGFCRQKEEEISEEPAEEGGFKSGKWSADEHQRFLEGLKLFGKDWTKIEKYVGTRSVRNLMNHG